MLHHKESLYPTISKSAIFHFHIYHITKALPKDMPVKGLQTALMIFLGVFASLPLSVCDTTMILWNYKTVWRLIFWFWDFEIYLGVTPKEITISRNIEISNFSTFPGKNYQGRSCPSQNPPIPKSAIPYLFLKSPLFHACIKSAQAKGLSRPMGGVCPW